MWNLIFLDPAVEPGDNDTPYIRIASHPNSNFPRIPDVSATMYSMTAIWNEVTETMLISDPNVTVEDIRGSLPELAECEGITHVYDPEDLLDGRAGSE